MNIASLRWFNAESLCASLEAEGRLLKQVTYTEKFSELPDRYVMLGNHRDAWGYGAADPSSGTAQLLETVRVFGTLLRDGKYKIH